MTNIYWTEQVTTQSFQSMHACPHTFNLQIRSRSLQSDLWKERWWRTSHIWDPLLGPNCFPLLLQLFHFHPYCKALLLHLAVINTQDYSRYQKVGVWVKEVLDKLRQSFFEPRPPLSPNPTQSSHSHDSRLFRTLFFLNPNDPVSVCHLNRTSMRAGEGPLFTDFSFFSPTEFWWLLEPHGSKLSTSSFIFALQPHLTLLSNLRSTKDPLDRSTSTAVCVAKETNGIQVIVLQLQDPLWVINTFLSVRCCPDQKSFVFINCELSG